MKNQVIHQSKSKSLIFIPAKSHCFGVQNCSTVKFSNKRGNQVKFLFFEAKHQILFPRSKANRLKKDLKQFLLFDKEEQVQKQQQ